MNNKGQMASTEAIIIIVLIAACLGLGYLLIHKPSQNSIYQAGSKPNITEFTPQCAPFSCCSTDVDNWKKKHDAIGNKTRS